MVFWYTGTPCPYCGSFAISDYLGTAICQICRKTVPFTGEIATGERYRDSVVNKTFYQNHINSLQNIINNLTKENESLKQKLDICFKYLKKHEKTYEECGVEIDVKDYLESNHE